MAANGKNQQCKSPAGQRRICVYYHEETGRCTVHASSLWQEAISKRKGKKDDRSQEVLGTHGRIRTCDTWLRRPVLYPLSYVGMRKETFGIIPAHILPTTRHSRSSNGRYCCLLYTSPSPRDGLLSRMPSSA